MPGDLRDNTTLQRFELDVDGHIAFVHYRVEPGTITLVHTEVPPALGGRGVGSTLARKVLEEVRALGLKVVVKCPFIAAFMGKHSEFNDLLR